MVRWHDKTSGRRGTRTPSARWRRLPAVKNTGEDAGLAQFPRQRHARRRDCRPNPRGCRRSGARIEHRHDLNPRRHTADGEPVVQNNGAVQIARLVQWATGDPPTPGGKEVTRSLPLPDYRAPGGLPQHQGRVPRWLASVEPAENRTHEIRVVLSTYRHAAPPRRARIQFSSRMWDRVR
jgi:hypothetical protein